MFYKLQSQKQDSSQHSRLQSRLIFFVLSALLTSFFNFPAYANDPAQEHKRIIFEARSVFADSPFEDRHLRVYGEQLIPSSIKTINIGSGFPLTSSVSPTGGFGDVAANFNAAVELKRLYPHLTINFFVTSDANEQREGVRTSADIVKIMAPELDISKVLDLSRGSIEGRSLSAQSYKGINVYFLSTDAEEFIRRGNQAFKQLPRADLGLQFSANNDGVRSLLAETSTLVMDYKEYMGPKQINRDRTAARGSHRSASGLPIRSHNAGLFQDGLYMSSGTQDQEVKALEAWARQTLNDPRFTFSGRQVAFSYVASRQASLNYANAIREEARLNPSRQLVLISQDFDGMIDMKTLPPNLKVITYKSLSQELFAAAVAASTLAPLVTGDSSLSQALSSARKGRFLIYETPSWKKEFTEDLIKNILADPLASSLSPEQKDLFRAVMTIDIGTMNPSEVLRKYLNDVQLQDVLSGIVKAKLPKANVYKNALRLAELERRFEFESRNGLIDLDTFDILKRAWLSSESEQQFLDKLRAKVRPNENLKQSLILIAILAKHGEYTGARASEFVNVVTQLDLPLRAVFYAFAGADHAGPITQVLMDSPLKTEFLEFLSTHTLESQRAWLLERVSSPPRTQALQGTSVRPQAPSLMKRCLQIFSQ